MLDGGGSGGGGGPAMAAGGGGARHGGTARAAVRARGGRTAERRRWRGSHWPPGSLPRGLAPPRGGRLEDWWPAGTKGAARPLSTVSNACTGGTQERALRAGPEAPSAPSRARHEPGQMPHATCPRQLAYASRHRAPPATAVAARRPTRRAASQPWIRRTRPAAERRRPRSAHSAVESGPSGSAARQRPRSIEEVPTAAASCGRAPDGARRPASVRPAEGAVRPSLRRPPSGVGSKPVPQERPRAVVATVTRRTNLVCAVRPSSRLCVAVQAKYQTLL